MRITKITVFAFAFVVALVFASPASAQFGWMKKGLKKTGDAIGVKVVNDDVNNVAARIDKASAESDDKKSAPVEKAAELGEPAFEVSSSYEATLDAITRYLRNDGFRADVDREKGQIVTDKIKDGVITWKNIVVDVRKVANNHTKVEVSFYKGKNDFGTFGRTGKDASTNKYNEKESLKYAQLMRTALANKSAGR